MAKSALLGIFLSLLILAPLQAAETAQPAATSTKEAPHTVVRKKTVHKKKAAHRAVRRHAPVAKAKTHRRVRHVRTASLHPHERLVRKVELVHGRRRVVYVREAVPAVPAVPPVMSPHEMARWNMSHNSLALASSSALVIDESSSKVLYAKNADVALPMASITKLMTGMVVLDAHQDMNQIIEVTDADVDRIRYSSSRLRVGSRLTRAKMLHIALMSSENRAASALGRNYPGGLPAFVAAMNAKARELGMTSTHYVEPTGLSSDNVASARDLAKLLAAASHYPTLCRYTTDQRYVVRPGHYQLLYQNSNRLVDNPDWDIGIQKTGFINEAGHCLVMQANIDGRPVLMIFLDSQGKYSRLADANRVRHWLERNPPPQSVAVNTRDREG